MTTLLCLSIIRLYFSLLLSSLIDIPITLSLHSTASPVTSRTSSLRTGFLFHFALTVIAIMLLDLWLAPRERGLWRKIDQFLEMPCSKEAMKRLQLDEPFSLYISNDVLLPNG